MALKQSSFGRVLLFALVIAQPAPAQISAWKLGGAGLSWSESDTTRLFIDFVSAPGSIQPIYLTPEKTVFSHLDNWVFWRDPSDIVLGYVDGETPRTWKWSDGLAAPSGSLLIDGDDATYYPPRAVPLEREVYTMDLAVAVPAISFGFTTPSQGFRSDGTPLKTDAIPGYDVSIASESERPVVEGTLEPLSHIIADVAEISSPASRSPSPAATCASCAIGGRCRFSTRTFSPPSSAANTGTPHLAPLPSLSSLPRACPARLSTKPASSTSVSR